MRKYRAERRAQNASPKEALLSQAKQQLASLDDPNLKKIMSGLIEELSPQRSLRPPPLQPLRPDATERAPAGMTPGGFRTPGVSPSKRVSFDLSRRSTRLSRPRSRRRRPPAPSRRPGTGAPGTAPTGRPTIDQTPCRRSDRRRPRRRYPGRRRPRRTTRRPWPGAPPVPPSTSPTTTTTTCGGPRRPRRRGRAACASLIRSRRRRPATTEDRAVDAFRSFLTAFDGERARQRKGLEACAARTMRWPNRVSNRLYGTRAGPRPARRPAGGARPTPGAVGRRAASDSVAPHVGASPV